METGVGVYAGEEWWENCAHRQGEGKTQGGNKTQQETSRAVTKMATFPSPSLKIARPMKENAEILH